MSAIAERVVEQFKVLAENDQQEVLDRILGLRARSSFKQNAHMPFPTVRVKGGAITSEQVAEALDE